MPKLFPTSIYVIAGAAGGGSDQYVSFLEKIGPSSYAAGGFVIDLSATYSSLNSFNMAVKKGTRGNVPFGRFEYQLNTPSAGRVTVLIRKYQYTKTTAFGNVTSQPGGVTVQGASGSSTSSDGHTHNADHDHGAASSGALAAAGDGFAADLLSPAVETHTHSVDLPNFLLTTPNTSHSHVDNSIYQHSHDSTRPIVNLSSIELPAATNLSATTFHCVATGVRA